MFGWEQVGYFVFFLSLENFGWEQLEKPPCRYPAIPQSIRISLRSQIIRKGIGTTYCEMSSAEMFGPRPLYENMHHYPFDGSGILSTPRKDSNYSI